MNLKEKLSNRFEFIRNLAYGLKVRRGEKSKLIIGNNNKIENHGRIYKVTRKIIGDNNKLIIGKNTTLRYTKISVKGYNNTIILGENCDIEKGHLWIEGNNCKIIFDKYVKIFNSSLAALEDNRQITIGEYSQIGYETDIRTSDSHSIYDITTKERINPPKDISIGKHVWIAGFVTVLKGVSIADNVIVGAGALVTKDLPANIIAGGIPAKVLRENTNWAFDYTQ